MKRPADLFRALRHAASGAATHGPGRFLFAAVQGLVRVQIFDRSMTLAAQAFTSIFPILILLGTVLGARRSAEVADAADLPEASQRLLDDTLRGSGVGAFGVVGVVAVLISATGLSRALGRAYGYVWDLPRAPAGPAMTLRWLVTVIALSVFFIGSRLLGWVTDRLPPSELSSAVLLALADVGLAVLVPWLVLARAVPARMLVPGGLLFALAMLALRPAASVVLPRAMDVSVERYGTIGLAFTYVSWLYVLSFTLLGTAVAGQALARDPGPVGRFVRGRHGHVDPEAGGGRLLATQQNERTRVGLGRPGGVHGPWPEPGVVHGGRLGRVDQHPADEREQGEDAGDGREPAVDGAGTGHQDGQQHRADVQHRGDRGGTDDGRRPE